MAYNYGPPAIDFTPLARLGETFMRARDQADDRARKEEFRTSLAALGQGNLDYEALGHRMLSMGDVSNSIGFLKLGQAERERRATEQADREVMGLLYGGSSGGSPSYGSTSGTPRANIDRNTVHVAENEDDVQRLERATGQLLSPQDRDAITRTVYGEASGEGPVGQAAVAGVIANRARQSGMTPVDVVLAKGQFEPWSDPAARARMQALDPNSADYQRVASAALPVVQGQAPDPTGGADHFYAPKAQAALGRNAPSWDDGTGQDIGNHRFFSQGYNPRGNVQVAQADIPAEGARNAQGFAIPGQGGNPQIISNLERALLNPNISEGRRKALQSRLDREYKLQEKADTASKDRYEPLKGKNGQVVGLWDKQEGRQLSAEEAKARGIQPQQAQPQSLDFGDITGVRKEVQSLPSYKSYTAAIPAYSSMVDAAKRNTKAADLNLVYGLAKIMDPTSVVREGEMIMVNNTQGLSDQVIGLINSVNGGARLSPEARANVMQEAQSRINGFRQSFDSDLSNYRGLAQRWGIREEDIIPSVPGVPAFSLPPSNGGRPVPSLLSPQPMAVQGGAMQGNGWKIIGVE